MTQGITVAIATPFDETRLRARRMPAPLAHRWAVPMLLQSPPLGCPPPVRVVRYAESPVLSFGLRRVDDLGFEPCTRCYDVEVLESVGGGAEREARGGFDERSRGCRGERP